MKRKEEIERELSLHSQTLEQVKYNIPINNNYTIE